MSKKYELENVFENIYENLSIASGVPLERIKLQYCNVEVLADNIRKSEGYIKALEDIKSYIENEIYKQSRLMNDMIIDLCKQSNTKDSK